MPCALVTVGAFDGAVLMGLTSVVAGGHGQMGGFSGSSRPLPDCFIGSTELLNYGDCFNKARIKIDLFGKFFAVFSQVGIE